MSKFLPLRILFPTNNARIFWLLLKNQYLEISLILITFFYGNYNNNNIILNIMPVLHMSTWQLSQRRICLQCRRLVFDPWFGKISWRRKWKPTLVFLPGKSHRQWSLVGYSPWGHKESDTTERLHCHFHFSTEWFPWNH